MSRYSRARVAVAVTGALALLGSLVAAAPAAADHTPVPERVTLMGNLMDDFVGDLRCEGDWDEACTLTDLQRVGEGQVWELEGKLPAGSYEFKVRLNGSWDENYGAAGAPGGANIPLVLEGDAEVRFTYDHSTHVTSVTPVAQQPPVSDDDRELAGSSLRRDLTRERFYFVMADRFDNGDETNDRAGIEGGRIDHGYDPTDTGFFHGGDLKGLLGRLDYIEGLGTTAIWLTPSFKNKPVQGEEGEESAGYHGYWITDFTQIDPHLGTNEELKQLIDAAHDRGIKVFFDIITNHTADVLGYRDDVYDANGQVPYRNKAQFPYVDVDGQPFDDRDYALGNTFPEVDLTSFPYEPTFLEPGDDEVKVPAWLNDPTMYHNRGTSTFAGEDSEYGDFPSGNRSALDDLWTERPEVVDGMIDIYQTWVREAGIDGFRIDTVKHVNMEFWQRFSPALTGYAASIGNDDFFMFGEIFDADPRFMSRYTTEGKLQAAVDFGFQSNGANFANGNKTTELRDFYVNDDYYIDTDSNAYSLPTFLGNHDMGRIGSFIRARHGDAGDAELLQRSRLGHSLMYLTRGQPVVYYGDEQGFNAPPGVPGGIGDQRARENMFSSQVDLYNSYDLIGTDATTAEANFDTAHPLYRHLGELSALRDAHPALADGAQVHRYASDATGVYAFSRIDAEDKVEYLVATNNSETAKTVTLPTYGSRTVFQGLWPAGTAQLRSDVEGRVTVTVPPLSAQVWKATSPVKKTKAAPAPFFRTPAEGGVVNGRAEIGVSVPGNEFRQTTMAWRPVGTEQWRVLGTDDNAPYRVFHDVSGIAPGTLVEYRAVVLEHDGDLGVAATSAQAGVPAPATGGGGGGGGGPVEQPAAVSVPGSHNSEIGCPGDWQPECDQAQMTRDAKDDVWKATFELPAQSFAYKAAINRSWDENYGAGGQRNGSDIPFQAPGGPVTFYYDHATNWITNDATDPIITAPGSFQSELGCPGDWQPDCMRSWLQDPDGDGTYTFTTTQIPAGAYEVKVAHGLSWAENYGAGGVPDGPNISFSVGSDGQAVTFSYVLDTHLLTIRSEEAGATPDLSAQRAQWLERDLLAWNLPAQRRGWTYRLHWAPEGGLAVDAEAVTGGSSLPLSLDEAGLPADVAAEYPHLAAYEALRLSAKDARRAEEILTGQVAVAAYDDLGRLRDATGVQLPGVLDDVYAGAADRELGVVWKGRTPSFALWAPTARSVTLLVRPPGASTDTRLDMRKDRDGVWTRQGNQRYNGGSYLYEVEVYVPSTGQVETNVVTDPYSLALTTDSRRTVIVDLTDPALRPTGWDRLAKPALAQPEDSTIYELHVRDFSIGDPTVPAGERGTYKAFTRTGSDGMKHLAALAGAGMNTLHLLPSYDLASVPERRADQAQPPCDLAALTAADPAGEEQQACVAQVRETDGFNWGYDPFHYTTPEGSYATDPEGSQRTREFREMVAAVNGIGMRVVMDVVYNHTYAAGQDEKSVLDRIVPGYYQRLSLSGQLETSTCCPNTATEHTMMEKLMVDSLVTWAREYKVDGFRFDLMGHHSRATMEKVRATLDGLTPRKDGVDGKAIYLYGEGWNFGEVANNARFRQATQLEMAGTGIGTFSDRLRDAVRGGGPFDDDPRIQGFATGLLTDPNGSPANGSPEQQAQRMLLSHDQIKVGLAGNLRDYAFVDRTGATVTGKDVDYNGSPAGYAADPSETVTYVDAHDNETIFDTLAYKLPQATSMADRVRMNTLALSTTALAQGPSFWHAGADILRSKSLDRNSYDSGDWFNRVDWSYGENAFGSGLPPAWDNESKWDYQRPLLSDPALKPDGASISTAHDAALDLLRIRFSSPLFRLGDAELVQERVSFPIAGTDQSPGVLVMVIDDRDGDDLDSDHERIVVVMNATPDAQQVPVEDASTLELHPVQAGGADSLVKETSVSSGTVEVPARTVAVLVQR
jgi:pullulanase-type alpha-1,6-glucosidase